MITKNLVVKIQNLVANQESWHIKSNPATHAEGDPWQHHKSIRKIEIYWHVHQKALIAKKLKRLLNTYVSEFAVANNTYIEWELLPIAKSRHLDGQNDLTALLSTNLPRSLQTNYQLLGNFTKHQRLCKVNQKLNLMLSKDVLIGGCVPECDREWLHCAKELLRNSNINLCSWLAEMPESWSKKTSEYYPSRAH